VNGVLEKLNTLNSKLDQKLAKIEKTVDGNSLSAESKIGSIQSKLQQY